APRPGARHDAAERGPLPTAADASATLYVYHGNQTTVTGPALKWKTFTSEAFGNLTQVTEPDQGGGANVTSNYAYTADAQHRHSAQPAHASIRGLRERSFTTTTPAHTRSSIPPPERYGGLRRGLSATTSTMMAMTTATATYT